MIFSFSLLFATEIMGIVLLAYHSNKFTLIVKTIIVDVNNRLVGSEIGHFYTFHRMVVY